MSSEKIIVGLDIGTTKICAIVGRENEFGKLEILGMGKAVSEGVVRGMVTNIDRTVNAINRAIEQAENQANIDIGKVNVGIAGHHIRSAIEHGSIISDNPEGEITTKDVKRLINDMYKIVVPPGKKIIHVMPQQFTVDDNRGIKDPVGEAGIRLEADFHVITADSSSINNIYKSVKRSQGSRGSLDIDKLILEPFASSMAVLNEVDKEMGVALIDIGGGTTDIAVFYDGIIRHTAVIPFGGEIITEDIREGCNILKQEAEIAKVKYGCAWPQHVNPREVIQLKGLRNRPQKELPMIVLSQIIQARVEDIIDLVHNELLSSGYLNKLGAGIILTGGGSQLKGIRELFDYRIGLRTQIGMPNEHLHPSKNGVEELKSPMYSTAIGLVLAGFRYVDEREQRFAENKVYRKEIEEISNVPEQREGFWKSFKGKSGFIDNLKGIILDNNEDDTDY